MANSSSLTNEVAYKLRYYMDVQRREDGFDLSGPNSPLSPYSSCNGTKSGSVLNFERLKDRSLKHYFTPQMIRTQIANLEAMPPGTAREREIKKKMKRRVRKSSYEEYYLTNDSEVQSEAYRAQLKALKRMERETSKSMSVVKDCYFKKLYKRYNSRSFSFGRNPKISGGETNRILNHASQILVATETVALAQEILNQRHAKQSAKTRPQSAPTYRHPGGVLYASSDAARGVPRRPLTAKARISGARRKLRRPKYCWDLHGCRIPIVHEDEEDFLQDTGSSSYASSSSLDLHHLSPNYRSEANSRNRPMSAKGSRTLPHVQYHDSRNRPLSADVIYVPHAFQHPVPPHGSRGGFSVDISTQTTEDVGSQTDFKRGQRKARSVIRKHNIKIWTGDRSGASTRAEVYVVLIGSRGKTEELFLTKTVSGSRPFRRGETDEFVIETHDIGDLKTIGIGHDQKEKDFSWYVDRIEVREGSDTFTVSCRKWFSGNSSDKKTFRYFDAKLLKSDSASDTSSRTSASTVESRSSVSSATQSSVARRKSEDSSHSSINKASSKSPQRNSKRSSVSSRDSANGRKSRMRVHARNTTRNRSSSSSSSSDSENKKQVHFEKKKQKRSKAKLSLSSKKLERDSAKTSEAKLNADGLTIDETKAVLAESKSRDSSSVEYSSDSSILRSKENVISEAPAVESNVELSVDSSVKGSEKASSSSSDSESTLSARSQEKEENPIRSTKNIPPEKEKSGSEFSVSSTFSSDDSGSDTDTVRENTKVKESEVAAVEIASKKHSASSSVKESPDKYEMEEKKNEKESIFSFFTSKKDSSSESESDAGDAADVTRSQIDDVQGKEVATDLDLTVATHDKTLERELGDFASTDNKMYAKMSSDSSSSSSQDSGSEGEDEKVEEDFNKSEKRLSIASLVNEQPTKLSVVAPLEEDRQELADVKEEPALAEVQEVRKLLVLEAEVHREKDSSSDDESALSLDQITSGEELSSSSTSESDQDEAKTPRYGVVAELPALGQEVDRFEITNESASSELIAPPPAHYVEPKRDDFVDKLKEDLEVSSEVPFPVTVDERQSSSSSESEQEKERIELAKESFEMEAPPPAHYIIPEQGASEENLESAEISVPVSIPTAEAERKSSSSSSSSSSESEEETVEDILSRGPDIHEAILGDNFERVKELIVKVPHVKEELNEKGWPPLHEAAASGRLNILKWLASNNVDVNSETQTGYTAMHVAAMNGHVQCMMVLKSFGVSVESRNVDGQTPLHLAAMGGQLDVVKWLVTNGGSHRARDSNRRSAKDFASLNHHKAVLDFLHVYANKMKTLGEAGSSSESSSSSSSSSSESERDEVSPLASESQASLMKRKEEEELEEKKRMFREQQEKMLKRKSSFLEEIRMETEQEFGDLYMCCLSLYKDLNPPLEFDDLELEIDATFPIQTRLADYHEYISYARKLISKQNTNTKNNNVPP